MMAGGISGKRIARTWFGLAAFGGAWLCLAQAGFAEVVDSARTGFLVRETAEISAPPARVYDKLVHPELWWDPAYTNSGNVANLSLDGVAGHCFCETVPGGGSVELLSVVYAHPGKRLVMTGGLGPLQTMGVAGALTVDLSPNGEKTDLTLTYAVGGYFGGAKDLPATADSMLGDQVGRLKKYIETAKPD